MYVSCSGYGAAFQKSCCAFMLSMKSMLCLYVAWSQLGRVRRKNEQRLTGEEPLGVPLLAEQETAVHLLPVAEEGFDILVGRNWLHLLPGKTGPVVSQDIVDPARQGLVTVAGHLAALLGVLQVQTAHSSQTQGQRNHSDQIRKKRISRNYFRFKTKPKPKKTDNFLIHTSLEKR